MQPGGDFGNGREEGALRPLKPIVKFSAKEANITQTVAALNETTRAGGLALGGSDGDTSANYANTWLSGYALNDSEAAHDAVVFINSFSPSKAAPKTNLPLIVLGNCNLQFADQIPDVFIPIATPGLDCSGTLFRVDSSVVLPLKKLHENELPLLADVAKQIEALL
jgi:formylmethanofuran dehydrogenase subunit B